MINLQAPEVMLDPFPTYAEMRKNFPVCQVEPDGLWALTRYEDVTYALKHHELFSAAGAKAVMEPKWLKKEYVRPFFIVTEDPPSHTKHRELINKTFITSAINDMIPLMEETANHLVTEMKSKDSIEFIKDFAFPYVGKIIGRITGTEDLQSIDEVHNWISKIETITPNRPSDEHMRSIEEVIKKQNSYFFSIIQDRRRHPRKTLITKLINTDLDGQPLTDELLISVLDLLVRAGFLTTVHLLGNSVIQLAHSPDIFEALREDPDRISDFIEEMLRWHSPTLGTIRQTTQDVTMRGVTVPKHSLVLIMLASANRDNAYFSNPEQFDMSKKQNHIAFGYGDHVCIGLALARLEVKIALHSLVKNFNQLICPEKKDLRWFNSFMMRGVSQLPLRMH